MHPLRRFARSLSHPSQCCRLLALSGLLAIPFYAAAAPADDQAQASQPSSHFNLSTKGRPTVSYALVRQHDTVLFVGNHKELAEATRHKPSSADDFLWVRKGQQRFLLDDPKAIGELLVLWQRLAPYEQQMQQLDEQMRQHTELLEERVAELEAALAIDELDHEAIRAFEHEREPLEQQIEPIGAEMTRIGAQIELLSATAHEQTLQAIETAIVSGTAKPIATP